MRLWEQQELQSPIRNPYHPHLSCREEWSKSIHEMAEIGEPLLQVGHRHQMERKARKRGDRAPDLHVDPEKYVAWLQRQRALPYVELARALDRQSRYSR